MLGETCVSMGSVSSGEETTLFGRVLIRFLMSSVTRVFISSASEIIFLPVDCFLRDCTVTHVVGSSVGLELFESAGCWAPLMGLRIMVVFFVSGWVGGFSVAGLLLVRLMFRKLFLVCLGSRWGRGVGRVSVVVGRLGLPVKSLYDGWFTPSNSVAVGSGVISVLIGSGGLENSLSPRVRSVMSVCIDCSIRLICLVGSPSGGPIMSGALLGPGVGSVYVCGLT